jgi:hypothetical protein
MMISRFSIQQHQQDGHQVWLSLSRAATSWQRQITAVLRRQQQVFLVDDDYARYKDWLAQSCKANGVEVWSIALCRIMST